MIDQCNVEDDNPRVRSADVSIVGTMTVINFKIKGKNLNKSALQTEINKEKGFSYDPVKKNSERAVHDFYSTMEGVSVSSVIIDSLMAVGDDTMSGSLVGNLKIEYIIHAKGSNLSLESFVYDLNKTYDLFVDDIDLQGKTKGSLILVRSKYFKHRTNLHAF